MKESGQTSVETGLNQALRKGIFPFLSEKTGCRTRHIQWPTGFLLVRASLKR